MAPDAHTAGTDAQAAESGAAPPADTAPLTAEVTRAALSTPEQPPAAPATARSTPATRGYSATKEQLGTRLRRIEGQVRGVQKMVEEDRYCIDVLTQISAIQAALDKVALGLLDQHAAHCVVGAGEAERDEKTQELMAAVGRLMRRG